VSVSNSRWHYEDTERTAGRKKRKGEARKCPPPAPAGGMLSPCFPLPIKEGAELPDREIEKTIEAHFPVYF